MAGPSRSGRLSQRLTVKHRHPSAVANRPRQAVHAHGLAHTLLRGAAAPPPLPPPLGHRLSIVPRRGIEQIAWLPVDAECVLTQVLDEWYAVEDPLASVPQ